MDERAILHRYKASRWTLVTGILLMFGFFQYEYIANKIMRWDYLIILGVMAVVKVAVRFYFHRTH